MNRVWRNYRELGTQDLVLRRRLETPLSIRREGVRSNINCTPISRGLISIPISATPHKIIKVIQVCGPISDHKDEDVEEFYKQFDKSIANTPKQDILLVQGDWNAKVAARDRDNRKVRLLERKMTEDGDS